MRGPGDHRREADVEKPGRRHRAQDQREDRRVLVARHQVEELAQRQQHQAETDEHAAEVVAAGARVPPEHQKADQDQRRRDQHHVERQHLHDQRGADIGAEHHRERRHEIDQAAGGEARGHQPGGGRALQYGGDAEAGEKGAQAVAQRAAENRAQLRSEGALDAALHHVRAPQQQRDGAGESPREMNRDMSNPFQ